MSDIVTRENRRMFYLRVCRKAIWGGLPTYFEEDLQRVQHGCLDIIGLTGQLNEQRI